MLRKNLACVLLCVMCVAAVAEEPGKLIVREGEDEISGKAWRSIAVVADDNQSILQLKVYKGSGPTLGISPKKTIFPDKTDIASKRMEVSVTLRSTSMDAPLSQMWQMPWMNYEVAVGHFLPDQIKEIFNGDSVTIQFDKVGVRYRFITSGAGYETVGEEVAKALSLAPTPEEDQARVDALLDEMKEKDRARATGLAETAGEEDPGRESPEVMEARKKGEEHGRSMRARTGSVAANLKEHEVRGRARSTADRSGFKKTSDPRRKAFIEGYMSQFPEFGPTK